jgi:hypothetical protein
MLGSIPGLEIFPYVKEFTRINPNPEKTGLRLSRQYLLLFV